jgi:hypothetical protein
MISYLFIAAFITRRRLLAEQETIQSTQHTQTQRLESINVSEVVLLRK